VTSYDRISQVKHLTRILRSSYLVKLGNLLNSRIRVERINLIELKLNSTITLILIINKVVTRFVSNALVK